MSVTHDASPAVPTAVSKPSLLRRCRFPLIVLFLCGAIFAIPWVMLALDFDMDNPTPLVMMTQWLMAPLAVLLIGVWWLFFSPVRWGTRLAGVIVVGVLGAGFVQAIRDVELTKGRIALVPRFHFIWEPTGTEQLADFLKSQKVRNALAANDATIGPEDFPRYRGSKFDGVVQFTNLEPDWSKHPPTIVWQHPCPGGYSGVAVAGNMAVTIEEREAGESVVCYDRATGQERWAYAYGIYYKDATHMGDGPRSTPTIHAGRIYSLGALGELTCLDADGKKIWSANALTDAKAKNTKWGLSGSPLIVDDLVVVNPGIDEEAPANSALLAYDLATGAIRWRAGNHKAGYSSPQLAVFGGKPQILLFDGAGLSGHDPATGAQLWQYSWETMYEMNSIQPVVLGDDRIFISSEKQIGCAMVRVKAPANATEKWSVETVWQNTSLGARYANPVTDGQFIYGLDSMQGVLTCVDAKTGKTRWKGDREGPGQMLLVGNQLLVINGDRGDVSLFATDTPSCQELARFPIIGDKTWNTPAVAGDQLFVRNQSVIVCLKLPRK
jgi:outer membrane protein assembly factor BamB